MIAILLLIILIIIILWIAYLFVSVKQLLVATRESHFIQLIDRWYIISHQSIENINISNILFLDEILNVYSYSSRLPFTLNLG